MSRKIFISYRSTEYKFVKDLVAIIEDNNDGEFEIWYDDYIDAGENWWNAIIEALQESHIVLLLLSREYLKSDACTSEFNYSLELKRPIIPIKIDPNLNDADMGEALAYIEYRLFDDIKKTPQEFATRLLRIKEIDLPSPLPIPPPAPIPVIVRIKENIKNIHTLSYEDQKRLIDMLRWYRNDNLHKKLKVDEVDDILRELQNLAALSQGIRGEITFLLDQDDKKLTREIGVGLQLGNRSFSISFFWTSIGVVVTSLVMAFFLLQFVPALINNNATDIVAQSSQVHATNQANNTATQIVLDAQATNDTNTETQLALNIANTETQLANEAATGTQAETDANRATQAASDIRATNQASDTETQTALEQITNEAQTQSALDAQASDEAATETLAALDNTNTETQAAFNERATNQTNGTATQSILIEQATNAQLTRDAITPSPIATERNILQDYDAGWVLAIAELQEKGFIGEEGSLLFEIEQIHLIGGDDRYQPFVTEDTRQNIVLSVEIQLAAALADDAFCALFIRVEASADSAIRVALTNSNLLTLEDSFQDTVVNETRRNIFVNLEESHHLLLIALDDRLTVFLDGEIVLEDVEIAERSGSLGFAISSQDEDSSCVASNIWAYDTEDE